MKVVRFLVMVLVGGLIGGLIGLLFSYTDHLKLFTQFKMTDPSTIHMIGILFLIIIVALLIWAFYTQKKVLKQKRLLDSNIEDEATDNIERKAALYFLNVSFLMFTSYVVVFLLFFIYVLGNVPSIYVFYPVSGFLLASLFSIPYGFFVRKYDSRYPKQGEKEYTEKTLSIMDEGERHITLVSMYKVYHINISLLIISIIILGIYSLGSNNNQTLALFVLIVLFIYNVFGYLLKVRKHYL
ncbi:DUF3169 family protein [Staphylococcus ratti]|uniref:DUF3169 family protein n=1 Tax=Staphylococcus ratti TaxID=2892440 RepID=A0ABY3PD11_9STAP|nr:DUF3169 family protein [Staphylococcus ratti]UEX90173.1 DUF3169 family protein [Staphylococcus ratti]